MKNRLMKFSVLATAVLAVGACAFPAAAFPKKLAYTFGEGVTGDPYCDGLTLTSKDRKAYHGDLVNENCAGSMDPAGGLVVTLGNRRVIEVIGGDASEYPNLVLVYYIDPKAMSWVLYVNEYYLNGTNDYVKIDFGVLIKGAPPSRRGGVSSLHAIPGVKLDRPVIQ